VITQLNQNYIDGFRSDEVIDTYLGSTIRGGREKYAASLQATDRLPIGAAKLIQNLVFWVSVVACLVVLAKKRLPSELRFFALTVVLGILGNAVVTAVLSTPEARYQSRVSWLVPLLAALLWLQVNPGASGDEDR
jgi:hypothetical protein